MTHELDNLDKIIAQIDAIEPDARKLEPSSDDREQLNALTVGYANKFLDQIEQAKGYRVDDHTAPMSSMSIPMAGRPFHEILSDIEKYVDSSGINPASGAHLGYIPGGGVFPSALGDYLAAATNRYAGIYYASPGAVRMENNMIRWIADLIGYPEGASGNLASGGSIANLIAVTAARDAHGIDSQNVRESVIYMTSQTHHCVNKAIRICGLGECQIRIVDLDANHCMRSDHLASMVAEDIDNGLNPFLIIGSVGSTDTGAVDPIDAIADIAQKHNLWFHVDAAYGGFFILLDELKHLFKGIDRTDSFVIDPHKGLFLPYGIGVVVVKDLAAVQKSHYYKANYMQDALDDAIEISPADLSPELTKHFRGLRMWLPLQLLGINPFIAALREKHLLSIYFHQKIAQEGFETGPRPQLSVVTYRYVPEDGDANTFNARLTKEVQTDGRIFISSTMINGDFWLRLAVLSFRTHRAHVDLLLSILADKRDHLLGN